MSLPINFPIKTEALMDLFRHNRLKASTVFPTDEPGTWEITAKTWKSLAPEDRPCTNCGLIMGYEIDPNTGDTCLDCTSPEGI